MSKGNPVRATCRIVVEETLKRKTLGVACVLKSEKIQGLIGYTGSRKKCDCFFAASRQVLTKGHLEVPQKHEDYKILAEFPEETGKDSKYVVNDIICSVTDDVWESKGILYIAITNPPKRFFSSFGKTSLETSRPLEVFDFMDGNPANELSGGVKCLVLEDTSEDRFRFLPYELAVEPDREGCSPSNKWLLKHGDASDVSCKDGFPPRQMAMGSVILTKEDKFMGFLYFPRGDKSFSPLMLGAASEEGER